VVSFCKHGFTATAAGQSVDYWRKPAEAERLLSARLTAESRMSAPGPMAVGHQVRNHDARKGRPMNIGHLTSVSVSTNALI
jgi:hypothetical protein